MLNSVWVFNGEGAQFPAGVFSSRDKAVAWIQRHGLTGLLTQYPLDEGVYDWAVREAVFRPKSEKHTSATFVQRFTSASQAHFHFEHGKQT